VIESYPWEKLFEAVSALASSPGPIRTRLEHTYTYSIVPLLAAFQDRSMPKNMKPRLEEIARKLRTSPATGLTGVRSAAVMSDDEAAELARRIVEIFSDAAIWLGEQHADNR
jgi:hypothetical protein